MCVWMFMKYLLPITCERFKGLCKLIDLIDLPFSLENGGSPSHIISMGKWLTLFKGTFKHSFG